METSCGLDPSHRIHALCTRYGANGMCNITFAIQHSAVVCTPEIPVFKEKKQCFRVLPAIISHTCSNEPSSAFGCNTPVKNPFISVVSDNRCCSICVLFFCCFWRYKKSVLPLCVKPNRPRVGLELLMELFIASRVSFAVRPALASSLSVPPVFLSLCRADMPLLPAA